MASRVRSSVAPTPTPGPSSRRQPTVGLPAYEPPQFGLNPAAQRALAELAKAHSLKQLEKDLEGGQINVSNSAGEINDRLYNKTQALQKTKQRKAKAEREGGDDKDTEDVDEIELNLEQLRDKVEKMTQRMDESMRKLIDGQHSVQFIRDSAASTAEDAQRHAGTQASTQNVRSQRRRRTEVNSDGEEEEDEDEDYQDFQPTDPGAGTQGQQAPIDAFRSKLEDEKTRYQAASRTARYAENNNYRNFRRVVHDALHPEEDEALPHEREWFPEDGPAPAPGVTTRRAAAAEEEDSDDDIAIARATISTKCPLTLMEFKQPLTSKLCPHSFESTAIVDMIDRSAVRKGGQPGARGATVGGEKAVQCPVTGCGSMLARSDLHTDAVLLRKIKRIQRAKELEEEAADDDEGEGSGGRSHVIPDDDDEDGADVDDVLGGRTQVPMKMEPRGTTGNVPPPSTSRSAVVDLGGSSDEEEEANEDTTMFNT